jgi:hypothetical protein
MGSLDKKAQSFSVLAAIEPFARRLAPTGRMSPELWKIERSAEP